MYIELKKGKHGGKVITKLNKKKNKKGWKQIKKMKKRWDDYNERKSEKLEETIYTCIMKKNLQIGRNQWSKMTS